jgi:hypothetical protein
LIAAVQEAKEVSNQYLTKLIDEGKNVTSASPGAEPSTKRTKLDVSEKDV